MGNILTYPPQRERLKREKAERRMASTGRLTSSVTSSTTFQKDRKIVLPFQDTQTIIEAQNSDETGVKMVPDTSFEPLDTSQFEMETLKLDTPSFSTPRNSTMSYQTPRSVSGVKFIKRYRSEEEKLMDIIKEREAIIRSAVKQGQQLRAKCNRYKEELDSLKALGDVDMTDVEWRRRYEEMENRYRSLKEEYDVISVRSHNSSLSSLPSKGAKAKVTKKGLRTLQVTKLQVDKNLLEDRVRDLTVRNARGRQYLSKLEQEKRDQEDMLTMLKRELLKEKQEKENLIAKVQILTASQENLADLPRHDIPVYAQVNKPGQPSDTEFSRTIYAEVTVEKPMVKHFDASSHETQSQGFDIELSTPRDETSGPSHGEYETVEARIELNDENENTGDSDKSSAGSSTTSDDTSSDSSSQNGEEDKAQGFAFGQKPPSPELVARHDDDDDDEDEINEPEPRMDNVPESTSVELYSTEMQTKF